jgi:hypothetical protein
MTRPIRTCDRAAAARIATSPRIETVREYETRVEAEYRAVRAQQWAQADAAGDDLSIPLTAIFLAPRGQ